MPHPERPLPLVYAGQSDVGMRFTAQHADYAFVIGDISDEAVFAANRKLQRYAEEAGRKGHCKKFPWGQYWTFIDFGCAQGGVHS